MTLKNINERLFSIWINWKFLLKNFFKKSPENSKLVVFFIVHKTLSLKHIRNSLLSIASQDYFPNQFIDEFIIYNSNQQEFSNSLIFEILNDLGLNRKFSRISEFPYHQRTKKTLVTDISEIRSWSYKNLGAQDNIFLLKSDIFLSRNYFSEIKEYLNIPKPIYFVSPFVLSKSSVKIDEIVEYSKSKFRKSDEVTFFSESSDPSILSDFELGRQVKITDKAIKFISCTVKWDFSCHLLTNALFRFVIIRDTDWGGLILVNYFLLRCLPVSVLHYICIMGSFQKIVQKIEKALLKLGSIHNPCNYAYCCRFNRPY
jgi:hypothetical protein